MDQFGDTFGRRVVNLLYHSEKSVAIGKMPARCKFVWFRKYFGILQKACIMQVYKCITYTL